MFRYDKKVDIWSKKMIAGLNKVWGNEIPKKQTSKKSLTLPFLIDYLNKYLNKYGKTIIKRFNELTGLSYKINDFGYYINNTPVSLHNSEKLFISISQNHPFTKYPTVIIHEISHIYFYKYINSTKFLKTCNVISKKEKNELKEIITVIINKEFTDIIDKPDEGYSNHKNIRKQILKLWEKENPNFDKWVKEVIKIYKKN